MRPKSSACVSLFLLGAAIAAVVSVGGCSSDDSSPGVLSALGESCTRTADCKSGLACIGQVCATPGSGSDAGVVVVPPSPSSSPEAGAPGAAMGGNKGSAPEAGPPPRLGGLGESCVVTADCASGFVCVASAGTGGGICDLASYGLTPTGKTCSGECATAADCCELPPGGVAGNAAVKTCQDILVLLLGGSTSGCAAAAVGSQVAQGCFAHTTYCSTCATSNVWSCTNNQCVFKPSCQNDGPTINGCPTQTRTGRALGQFCDSTTHTCFNNARGSCNTGSDCDNKVSVDTGGTCRGGDCACYLGGCYFSCASNLDCPQGYGCDATASLCKPNGTCGSDAQCAAQTGMVNAKCVSGSCKEPCMTDHDCGGSGLVPGGVGYGGQVCGSDGFCQAVGCATDADCRELNHNMNPGSSTLNYFCAAPPAPPPPTPVSAITN